MTTNAPAPASSRLPTEQACPKCAAIVPVISGYQPWCEACGWNLDPPRFDERPRLRERIAVTLGRRLGEGLFREVQARPVLRPQLTMSAALAFVIAGAVHGVTLAIVAAGFWLLWRGWPDLGMLLAALICFGIAWALRPRVAPQPAGVLPREQAPTLYALVERVAAELQLPEPPAIVLTDEFNAGFSTVTWRRQPVLWLGLPLLALLDTQERVALIAHELAHGVNGDPQRRLVISTALGALDGWHQTLHPTRILIGGGLFGLAASLLSLALWLLSLFPYAVALLLLQLLWRMSQRAEYLADALSARIAGTAAAIAALERSVLGPFYDEVIQTIHFVGRRQNIIEVLTRRVASLPEREWERYRQLERRHDLRLDSTHPPTRFRIERLRQQAAEAPALELAPEEAAGLEAELAPLMAQCVVEDTRHLRV
jgi:Zn-dependent protease with chaperone function